MRPLRSYKHCCARSHDLIFNAANAGAYCKGTWDSLSDTEQASILDMEKSEVMDMLAAQKRWLEWLTSTPGEQQHTQHSGCSFFAGSWM